MPFVSLVQDFYNVTMPAGSSTQVYIDAKFEATTAHITNATSTLNPDQLYITFASAFSTSETPQVATYFYFLFFIFIHTYSPPNPLSDICVGNWRCPGYEPKAPAMVD